MIRVLHVIGSLNVGGSQALIMNIYRNIDRSKIQFDFVINFEEHRFYEPEIKKLGGKVYYIPQLNSRNYFAYCKAWNDFFEEHKEYKIVHGHVRSTAAIYLKIAKKHGCYTVAHSHNTSSGKGPKAVVKDLLQLPIRYSADYFMACSDLAGEWLFGKKVVQGEQYHMLPNAIPLEKFARNEQKRAEIRAQLGVGEEIVLGNVGRFTRQKNQMFLLDIFAAYKKVRQNAKLILVGYGEMESDIREKIEALHMESSVIIPKDYNEPAKYLQAMDVYVFPSIFEGLGISLIEAEAAGLPCVISEVIPKETYVTEKIRVCQSGDSLEQWVKAIETYATEHAINKSNGLLEQFDIKEIVTWISNFYFEHEVKEVHEK